LRDIAESPGGNQQSVSNNINVAAPALVSALGELERRGLIERMRNDQDRRSSVLYLTAAGRRLTRSVLERAGSISADAMLGMSGAESELLRDLLFRVKHNLQEKLLALEGS
jgi:DNA-binding MarR family transcriptional regulator